MELDDISSQTFKWEKHVYAGNYRFIEPTRDMPTKFTRWKHTHHDWHTFNGFYQSPFDRAVVFSMDGGVMIHNVSGVSSMRTST